MSSRICAWCGKTFPYNGRGLKRYCCIECKTEAQNVEKQWRKKEREEAEKYTHSRKKAVNEDAMRLAAEAIEHGMTYGKYVVMLESRKGDINQ